LAELGDVEFVPVPPAGSARGPVRAGCSEQEVQAERAARAAAGAGGASEGGLGRRGSARPPVSAALAPQGDPVGARAREASGPVSRRPDRGRVSPQVRDKTAGIAELCLEQGK